VIFIGGLFMQDDRQDLSLLERITNSKSRVLETPSGHKLGPLIGMGFISLEDFTDIQLLRIDSADRLIKQTLIGRPRQMGGSYEEHIKDMVGLYWDISRKVESEYKTPQELLTRDIISNIMHDFGEDDELIDGLRRDLRGLQSNGTGSPEATRIISDIKTRRDLIVQRAYHTQLNFVGQLYIQGLIDDKQRSELELECAIITGVLDWEARHVEDREYFQSVYHLSRIHKAREYLQDGRGGPFQEKVMEAFKISDEELEPKEYLSMRVFFKLLDRIVLSRERTPRFSDKEAGELEDISHQNQEVIDTYGEVRFTAEDMPRPYAIKLLYRNSVVLHNAGLALNQYGREIAEEQDGDAFGYLLKIVEARRMLVEESKAVIGELKGSYEAQLMEDGVDVIALQERINEIERIDSEQYEVITLDGSVTRGEKYDRLRRRELDDLDNTIEGRTQNYIDVLIYEKLFNRFADGKGNHVDPSAGDFRLFTIKGLTDILTQVKEPIPFYN
jgi:hypothetical protein